MQYTEDKEEENDAATVKLPCPLLGGHPLFGGKKDIGTIRKMDLELKSVLYWEAS